MSDLIVPAGGLLGPDGQPINTKPFDKPTKTNDQIAVELGAAQIQSRVEAAAAEAKQRQLEEAASWARSMNRAFKGLRPRITRKQRVRAAIKKFGLADV